MYLSTQVGYVISSSPEGIVNQIAELPFKVEIKSIHKLTGSDLICWYTMRDDDVIRPRALSKTKKGK